MCHHSVTRFRLKELPSRAGLLVASLPRVSGATSSCHIPAHLAVQLISPVSLFRVEGRQLIFGAASSSLGPPAHVWGRQLSLRLGQHTGSSSRGKAEWGVMGGVWLQGREGKVVQVYRRRWVIHIERLTREKVNGAPPPCVGNLFITLFITVFHIPPLCMFNHSAQIASHCPNASNACHFMCSSQLVHHSRHRPAPVATVLAGQIGAEQLLLAFLGKPAATWAHVLEMSVISEGNI